MDRATVVRLYQASLQTRQCSKQSTKQSSKPPLKRPKRTDLDPKQTQKETKEEEETKKACFVSPMNGKWYMDVKATGVPPLIPKRLPMCDMDAMNCLKQQPIPYGMSELEWNVKLERLIAIPESNYAFWNRCEPSELSVYAIHFYKLDFFVGNNKNFHTNWLNVAKAYRFAMQLYDKYEFDDEEEMAPKAAVASGRAFNSMGTFLVDEGGTANERMLVLRDIIKASFASSK